MARMIGEETISLTSVFAAICFPSLRLSRILYSVKTNSTCPRSILAKEGIRDDEMSRILGIRSPYVVKRLRRIADRFTESRLKQCLELAASSEQDVKTGDLQEFTALEMLMVELLERG